ncbi:MAG: HAMP domain-containing histidine kinase [Coriobacteriales bacterium]|jgi:signal transduction histidine kinase|nr:HAMP domain-containing histidine kinase [Coriobacteriales bacterium]
MKKLRSQFFLLFAGSFFVFALIIGLLFTVLFWQHNLDIHKASLEYRAVRIADALSDIWSSPQAEGQQQNRGSNQGQGQRPGSNENVSPNANSGGNPNTASGPANQGSGYGSYIHAVNDLAMADFWIIDSNLDQITRGQGKANLAYQDLPDGARDVILAALAGETAFSEDFGAFLDAPSITVATPVVLANGEVVGVVLLHEQIASIEQATVNGLFILLLSLAAAIILSLIIASLLALRFTQPLAKMRSAAVLVSQGNFLAQTGVRRNDEIGELASAFDDMATQLDTTSREAANQEKQRREFMANISHELRTPVTVIRGSLEALHDGLVTDQTKVTRYYEQMLNESIQLERLVQDLFDLAKLESPDLALEMATVDLRQIALDAIRSIDSIARVKGIEVRLQCQGVECGEDQENDRLFIESGYMTFGDYGRLRQLVLVLLDNAVKFSPEQSLVEVLISKAADKLVLSVSDMGPGIVQADLDQVFDRFYQQRTSKNQLGSGLGLAIGKQIADLHKADLTVVNNQDCGCQFSLIINASNL